MWNGTFFQKINETDRSHVFLQNMQKESFHFFYDTDILAEADHRPIKQAGYPLSAILPVWIFLKCSRNYFRNAGEIIVSALIY